MWWRLTLTMVVLAASGCTRESYYRRQVPWGYVFDKGSPREIADWTLAQEDQQLAVDGQTTLRDLTHLRKGRDAREAAQGFLKVHEALLRRSAAHPGEVNVVGDRRWTWALAAEHSRNMAASERNRNNPAVNDVWERLVEVDPEMVRELERVRRPRAGLFGD